MERQRKPAHPTAYPDIKAFVRRYQRRAACGLVAGAITASTGCDWFKTGTLDPKPEDDTGTQIDGMIAETAETWSLTLPLEGSRELYFESPWGWVQYRLGVLVDRQALRDWLYEHPDAALATVDGVLAGFGIARFETDDGFTEVESAIAAALEALFQEATGDERAGFLEVDLSIEGYQDEDDVPGDVAEPG
ncbi:MAG: hypothetical protein ABIO70_08780 [Pseudomonadota bacterium]